ncbi:MAG: hypothetical protein JNN07_08500 [Verrucomicrobiales bacterium]|nr:hypothetical protein [Verrucomicrobiales bacterium]
MIASLLNSGLFFLVTNFGVWFCVATDPKTSGGLLECYAAGLPLLANGPLGDLFYAGLLFGSMSLTERRLASLRAVTPVPSAA